MWVVLNNAFFSIVQNENNEEELLVRARVKGDIEKIFPKANVFEDNYADYKYRSFMNRENVASTIKEKVLNINYGNFKSSVSKSDYERSSAYAGVWSALYKLQK